jgi:hypothetical protein
MGCAVAIALLACAETNDPTEVDSGPPCIRYCRAANKVPGCERFADCELSCANLEVVYGSYCIAPRLDFLACAASTDLVCVDGHAAPPYGSCTTELQAVRRCDACGGYCQAAAAAGCLPPDCFQACQARQAQLCFADAFYYCQGRKGVSCLDGEPVSTAECAEEAAKYANCVGTDSPCLGSCVAAEAAGCPAHGRDACTQACESQAQAEPCGEGFLDWKYCESWSGVRCGAATNPVQDNCRELERDYVNCRLNE